jgi:hypothetical protein
MNPQTRIPCFSVTSSEKVDKENRYCDFNILCTPYPGCEFFKDWKDNNYAAEGMKFDWNQVCNILCCTLQYNMLSVFYYHVWKM